MNLHELIASQTESLIQQALNYAMICNAAQFEAVDVETWRAFVEGVCRLFLDVLNAEAELPPQDGRGVPSRDSLVVRFGGMNARRHRSSGLSLSVLLILASGYRRGCMDLIRQEQSVGESQKTRWEDLVERFFDSVELGLCLAWPGEERQSGARSPSRADYDTTETTAPTVPTALTEREERILVVDADPEAAEELRYRLSSRGYRVVVAHSARQALREAAIPRLDLVLLDVLLPDADGFSVLEWLKLDRKTQDIPVVLTSLIPDDGHWKSLGAAGFLSKPVQQGDLLDCLPRVLGNK